MATGPDPAGTRFFCTTGRGLEPFVLREVRARLGAKQVEYVSGKVFFTTSSDLNTLKRLKSAERLFLLVKRQHPLPAYPRHKEKTFRELQRLVHDAPELWLEALSTWERLLAHEAKERTLSPRTTAPQGKRAGDSEALIAKKLRTEHTLEEPKSLQSGQLGKEREEEAVPGHRGLVSQDPLPGIQGEAATAAGTKDPGSLTFRVSCRCSGAIAKAFTTQEVSRLVGVALMKQFGWRADLRRPRLEVFLHLSDVYSVVGIPVLRVPLASRAYIQTAGLRSTVAWAMASLAEIQAGAFVLDPMCGLGTILLEAAREWPNACYVGADISDAQLVGAGDNLTAAGFWDRVELLKASVTGCSESVGLWCCCSVKPTVSSWWAGKVTSTPQEIPAMKKRLSSLVTWAGQTRHPHGAP
ncbi:THUMP domain-containing protein 2 isoform X4 [Erinaceus europaeus]|uniref:THUMP domain-containing protein 2 isoform X4 n=1 Tax=Erinaceus europaeus TaxID=9365 RepID=A0ABM3X266_ERIEU|nr:THUMP domain-containing protein 2 isoform X4 [Erinaceus europaeus]XP_060042911.1 THUMP domain-containing protein 2 isoform X4 [Erinaceus europaeus]